MTAAQCSNDSAFLVELLIDFYHEGLENLVCFVKARVLRRCVCVREAACTGRERVPRRETEPELARGTARRTAHGS